MVRYEDHNIRTLLHLTQAVRTTALCCKFNLTLLSSGPHIFKLSTRYEEWRSKYTHK